MAHQTARAGPPRGDAETGSQDPAHDGARRSLNANIEVGQDDPAWSPADRRLACGGLSEYERELRDCTPVASDPRLHARLWGDGVRNSLGMEVEPVVFPPNDRFEFARYARDASDAAVAVVFHAPDELGNPLDLAAWEPETGHLALWLGRVAMLGQDNLYGWRVGEPLVVHETALEWLQAGREGVLIIDPQRASPLLRMVEPLGVRCPEFGRQLQAALTIRAPRIVAAAQRRAA
jgi:hypothetical protein